MQKSKEKNGLPIYLLCALILGILTAVTIFLPAIYYTKGNSGIIGYVVAFGGVADINGSKSLFFNWGATLGYLLPVIAGLLAFFVGKKSKFFTGISAFLFLLSGILLFCNVNLFLTTCYEHFVSNTSAFEPHLILGYGAWIGGFLSMFAFIACVVDIVKSKLN